MWTPIFIDNADNVITVLDTYVEKMLAFREAIAKGDKEKVDSLITEANRIKKVLLK
jgi:prephenate dehydrogenase